MKFCNKVALITGAASGIGRATAHQMAQQGADLIVTDIDTNGLITLQEEITAMGRTCHMYPCDIANETAVREMVASAVDKMGHIDILVNNAGIFREGCMPFDEQNTAIWKRKIDINIYGVLYTTHAVLPHMYAQRYGRIVNIASVAALYGIPHMTDYSMTKGAVLSFTYALAKEAAAYGVAVNAMSPGNIGSKDTDGGNSLSYLDRRGEPAECAKVICFLASDDASWVSGVNFTADGCRKKL